MEIAQAQDVVIPPPTTRQEVAAADESDSGRYGGILFSLRTRLVVWFALLLLLAVVVALVVARATLLARVDARIDASLAQEVEELRALAVGSDPETAQPFGDDVARIFEVYLQRNVPMANEALITFHDGAPYLRSRPVVPYRLDLDEQLSAHWAGLAGTERATVMTPAGSVRYLAVPLRVEGETAGVFVGAIFRDLERQEVDDTLASLGFVGLAVLVAGCLLALWLARRVLDPIAAVTATAQRISETDLTERIPVRGRDEIADLASTCNTMLERLETAFAGQRRFIDDVGHELRTPLTIVRGHLEQLDEDAARRRETLELVLDELDRMGRLIGELLILARAQRPDFLDLKVVDVERLTHDLLSKASAFGTRRWLLDAAWHGHAVLDPQRLTQAAMQLVENAVRQTTEDDTIALGSAVADGSLRVWVRDTGPGVPAEEQVAIFQRFRRGSGGVEGTGGLGLSIVQAIAEAHRGHVEVQSPPGAGATFVLVVPAGAPPEES